MENIDGEMCDLLRRLHVEQRMLIHGVDLILEMEQTISFAPISKRRLKEGKIESISSNEKEWT